MKESTQSLISRGAIFVVDPCPEQFISTLFLLEKGPGTGEFHPVINWKAPNRFPPKEKFKMEGLHTTRSLLRRGDFMMKLGLKDAYNAVPIHPESRKYLWFYHEGRTYEFCCLPFSLSLAPCFFTTILHPIIARLCSEGIQTVIYLYDLLLIHHQKDQLTEIFNYVRRLSSGLGFIVKLEKCSPEPTHRLVSVGHDLHVDFPARQADRSDTRSMPDDARVSVNISGRAVKPAELHEPCGMDRSVSSTFTLQSPTTPAGFATPLVWVATQVSDMFVSTICGGPEVVGVVESTLSQPSGHHLTLL